MHLIRLDYLIQIWQVLQADVFAPVIVYRVLPVQVGGINFNDERIRGNYNPSDSFD